jgi:hypothetical protein
MHAIWGSAASPTAQHQRDNYERWVIARANRTAGSSVRW